VTQVGLHELGGHSDGVRKVSSATETIVKGVNHAERDSLDRLADVGHLVVVVQIGLAGGAGFIEVGLQFVLLLNLVTLVATADVLGRLASHDKVNVGL